MAMFPFSPYLCPSLGDDNRHVEFGDMAAAGEVLLWRPFGNAGKATPTGP
jgi:hypothetical protein